MSDQPDQGKSRNAANIPSSGDFEHILVTQDAGLKTITFNRPTKYNALNGKMYREIITALQQASQDDSVVTLITGAGKYFCSGQDLNDLFKITADSSNGLFREFVSTFIDFPKPIVAAVNGPAVGAGVTLLGLVDMVYASDTATFHTPFTSLGLLPEACSSYLFPKIMGHAKASEVLLAGRKLNAVEACNCGFVTDVFPQAKFEQEVHKRMQHLVRLPPKSLALSKQLCRSVEKDKLHDVSNKECEFLEQISFSEEPRQAVMAFMRRKAKL